MSTNLAPIDYTIKSLQEIFERIESPEFASNFTTLGNPTLVIEYWNSSSPVTVLITAVKSVPNVADEILKRMSGLMNGHNDIPQTTYWYVMKHCPDARGGLFATQILAQTRDLDWGQIFLQEHN